MSTRISVTALAVLGAAIAASAAQAPTGSAPSQPPTFRSEVRYVEIDANVTDPQGRFVRNLTKDSFEILEDGMRQEIATFSLIDLPIDPPPAPGAATMLAVEPDVTTNIAEGRLHVMLLDQPCCGGRTGNESLAARQWAQQFVNRSFRPGDIMAVVHVQGNLVDGQPFTANKRLLLSSIGRLNFAATGLGFSPDEILQRLRNTFRAIEDLSERLGTVTGRRKAILWVNAGVPFNPADTFEDASRQSSAAFMQRDAIRAATRNNVALYPIDSAGLTTTSGLAELKVAGALRAIAEDTGGEAVVGTNNFAAASEGIVRHNSTYYLLGYYPTIQHSDNKFHTVRVRVKPSVLSVHAKKGYFAPHADTRAPVTRSLLDGLSASGRDALRSPASVRGLAIELSAAPFKGAKEGASVLVAAQLGGRDLRLGASDQVEISYQPIDSQGRILKGSRKVFTLNLRPDSRKMAERSGLRFVDRLDLPPGRHELRFAAHQPSGATGSVVAQIEVPDFAKDPVTMSGLVVASRNASVARALLNDERISRTLRADPTAIRRFTRDDELAVFVEVYTNRQTSSDNASVTYSVTSESGRPALTAPGRLESDDVARRARGYSARMSLASVSPGKYILTARAQAPDGASATRQIPFTIAGEAGPR